MTGRKETKFRFQWLRGRKVMRYRLVFEGNYTGREYQAVYDAIKDCFDFDGLSAGDIRC